MTDIHHTLTLLTRLAARQPSQEQRLHQALVGRLDELAEVVLEVAVETGDPIGQVLAEALGNEMTKALLERLAARLREKRFGDAVSLAEVAVLVWRRVAEAFPSSSSEPEDLRQAKFALLANRLSYSLIDLGEAPEALEWARRGAEGFRRLSISGTGLPASSADGLQAVGMALGMLGKTDEALDTFSQAIETLRREQAEGTREGASELALALVNYGYQLGELQNHQAALKVELEAVSILRDLDRERSSSRVELLATATNNLAITLSELGRLEEALQLALESADLFRFLADGDPQIFGSRAAGVVGNLGTVLSAFGRHEEALAAQGWVVSLRRKLFTFRPATAREDLAGSLRNLGVLLRECGLQEEALEALREAQMHYELLGASRRSVLKLDLAMTLAALAETFVSLGQASQGLLPAEKAVAILRDFVAWRPEVGRAELVGSLQVLFRALVGLERHEAACQLSEELEREARGLAEINEATYLLAFAGLLYEIGEARVKAGRLAEAVRLLEESLELKQKVLDQLRAKNARQDTDSEAATGKWTQRSEAEPSP